MEPIRPLARTVVASLLLLPACGGGGSTTSPNTGPVTATFSGTATYSAGGCGNRDRPHEISAGEGTLVVTLTQASASPVALQVCHTSAVNHATECTIPPFARPTVGQSLSVTLKGGRNQVVTVFPDACGRSGTFPPVEVTYSITVTYPG